MSTIIVYATRHGCTEDAAKLLAERLSGKPVLVNLKKNKAPDLIPYQTIIVGGSIHAGRIQKKVKDFCIRNTETLLNKRLGLFLCHMEEGEKAEREFIDAYPQELRSHALARGLFGGKFDFERMNFLERKIIKKVAHIASSVSRVDRDAILRFAEKMQVRPDLP